MDFHHFAAAGGPQEAEGVFGEIKGSGQEGDEFLVGGSFFRGGRQPHLEPVAMQAHHCGAPGSRRHGQAQQVSLEVGE